jgi:hypothetical protein
MLVIIILLALLVFAMIVIGFKVSNKKEAAPLSHNIASFENPTYDSGTGQSNSTEQGPTPPADIADTSGGYLDVNAGNVESEYDTYTNFE